MIKDKYKTEGTDTLLHYSELVKSLVLCYEKKKKLFVAVPLHL
jgi:hypothetical protein